MSIKRIVAGSVSLAVMVAIVGCGGSSPSSSPAFSQSQALSATTDLFTAMESALESSGAPLVTGTTGTARVQAEAAGIRGALVTGIAAPLAASSGLSADALLPRTTLPSFTYTCPAGGNIVVTGSYSVTNTTSTAQITETINKCNDGTVTISGNPNVVLTDNASLSGNVYTDVLTLVGGFTAGSSTCAINVNISASVNDITYAESGSISGSVCGVNVSGTL